MCRLLRFFFLCTTVAVFSLLGLASTATTLVAVRAGSSLSLPLVLISLACYVTAVWADGLI